MQQPFPYSEDQLKFFTAVSKLVTVSISPCKNSSTNRELCVFSTGLSSP